MRTSIAVAIVAATATVVSADCNPSYDVPTSTPCFTACNVKAGSSVLPGWTMDPSSENFLPSLKLMCTKGVPEYTEFMTTAGMCMMGCAGDDPKLFEAEFAGACAWYGSHKDDTCATETTTSAAATTVTTKATTTVETTTVQTTTADTTIAADTTTTAVITIATTTEALVPTTVAPVLSSNTSVSANIPVVSSGASAASSGAAVLSSSASVLPSSISPSVSDAIPSIPAESAAKKLQISGLAVALVAGAGYLAL